MDHFHHNILLFLSTHLSIRVAIKHKRVWLQDSFGPNSCLISKDVFQRQEHLHENKCLLDQIQGTTGDLLSLRNSSRVRRATEVAVSGALLLWMEVSASPFSLTSRRCSQAGGSNATRKKVLGVAPLSTSIAECRTRQNKTEKPHDLFIQYKFLSSV